jgi:hypothetical protein
MDTSVLLTDGWATSLEAAKANTLASSTAMAAHLNDELKKRYLLAFDGWKTSVLAGKIDNTNPPKLLPGYDVVTNQDGFAYPELGTKPVCEMPEIPPDYSKPFVQTLPEPDHVRNVPKGDTTPVGFIVTSDDGSQWQKKRSVTPFGVAYFYERVN